MQEKRRVWHLALTGGPCAGKTTALAYLTEKLNNLGFRVVVVPEAATLLIQSGIAPWVIGGQTFQRSIIELILSMEDIMARAGSEFSGRGVVFIHDRGIPDGRAYVSAQEFNAILSEFATNIPAIRDKRYDAVFHLRTAALGAEAFYTLATNTARRETVAEARALDEKTLSAWVGHSHLRIIGNETGFEEKLRRLYQEVCMVLGIPVPIEIERKFLIEPFNVSGSLSLWQSVDVEQIYLISPVPGQELRVRKRGQDGYFVFYRTTKRDLGNSERAETEGQIDEREYLWSGQFQAPETRIIRKVRTCFVHADQYFEYDRFLDPAGLHLLEIELTDRNDTIAIPGFIRVLREVTDDPAYKNATLARFP